MFATVMLHILPEASEVLGVKGEELEFHALPQLVICAGFFLIYFVEEVVEMVSKENILVNLYITKYLGAWPPSTL